MKKELRIAGIAGIISLILFIPNMILTSIIAMGTISSTDNIVYPDYASA